MLREYISAMSKAPVAGSPPNLSPILTNAKRFQRDFTLFADTPNGQARLLDLLAAIPCGGKKVHDANIVATMLVNGVPNLLTHNTADFQRFGHLITVIPLVP